MELIATLGHGLDASVSLDWSRVDTLAVATKGDAVTVWRGEGVRNEIPSPSAVLDLGTHV